MFKFRFSSFSSFRNGRNGEVTLAQTNLRKRAKLENIFRGITIGQVCIGEIFRKIINFNLMGLEGYFREKWINKED